MDKKIIQEAYKKLAIGIVEQAVSDYKMEYLKALKEEYIKSQALGTDNADYSEIMPIKVLEIRNFFYSDWYKMLCDFIPKQVIEALDRQVFEKFDRYLERENKNAKL